MHLFLDFKPQCVRSANQHSAMILSCTFLFTVTVTYSIPHLYPPLPPFPKTQYLYFPCCVLYSMSTSQSISLCLVCCLAAWVRFIFVFFSALSCHSFFLFLSVSKAIFFICLIILSSVSSRLSLSLMTFASQQTLWHSIKIVSLFVSAVYFKSISSFVHTPCQYNSTL